MNAIERATFGLLLIGAVALGAVAGFVLLILWIAGVL